MDDAAIATAQDVDGHARFAEGPALGRITILRGGSYASTTVASSIRIGQTPNE
jgi:hypothetical protein